MDDNYISIGDAIRVHQENLKSARGEIRTMLNRMCDAYNQEHPEHLMLVHRAGDANMAVSIFDTAALKRASIAKAIEEGL